jgi:hypothetical protein
LAMPIDNLQAALGAALGERIPRRRSIAASS